MTATKEKKKNERRIGILILSFQFFMLTLMLFALHARFFGVSTIWFWPFFWISILCSLLIIYKSTPTITLLSLLLFSLGLASISLVALPEMYHLGTDIPYEIQTAENIINEGKWNPLSGTNFAENYYAYTPVLHFSIAFFSLTSLIEPVLLTKYGLTVLYKVLFALFVYLIFKSLFGKEKKITYLATLLFIGSTGMAFIGVTRRGTASLFVLLSLYLLLTIKNEKKQIHSYNFLLALFSLVIVFADRSISRYYLLFLCSILLFAGFFWILKKKSTFKHLFFAALSSFTFVAIASILWRVLFSHIFSSQDGSYISDIKDILFESNIESVLFSRSEESVSIYRWYESLVIYFSQLLFLGLSALGLLSLSRRKSLPNQPFLIFFGWFGLCTYALSLVLLTTAMDVAVIIILWLFSLPLCILTAHCFEWLVSKKVLGSLCMVVIVLTLFTGTIMTGSFTPRITNRMPTQDIVADDDMRAKSDTLLSAGLWIQNVNPDARVLGNVQVFETIGSFYRIEVNQYDDITRNWYTGDESVIRDLVLWQLFEFGSYKHTLKNYPFDYFVTNNIYYEYPSKVFGDPLSVQTKERYENIEFIDKVYSSDGIEIYRGNANAR